LFRAQKLIHRLRDDKSSLLDRVLELEIAAGVTSADVLASQQAELRTERELAFPLLHPPDLPSMADRPRPLPQLTTSTDFSNSNYNAPVGPAPLPHSFPPRQRSQHLRSTIAAQRLRDDYDSRLAAQGLQRPSFPAVAALGLQGSSIALTVERVLAGEQLETVSSDYQPQARGSKRRRESSAGQALNARGGRARVSAVPQSIPVGAQPSPYAIPTNDQPALQYLPNPFAAAGAVPEGTMMARNSAEALAAAQAATAAQMQIQHQIPVNYDTPGSATPAIDYEIDDGGSGAEYSEEEDYKPDISGGGGARGGKGGRQSTGPPKKMKKQKASALVPGALSIPFVPRNADGTPRLPLAAGIMTLTSLGGEIESRASNGAKADVRRFLTHSRQFR